MRTLALVPHPATPSPSVRSIVVHAHRGVATLTVSYVVEGDLERVRLPRPRPPARAEQLWQHTCCEMFVARNGSPAYHEFNFSPSGEWNAYRFAGYRSPTPSHG